MRPAVVVNPAGVAVRPASLDAVGEDVVALVHELEADGIEPPAMRTPSVGTDKSRIDRDAPAGHGPHAAARAPRPGDGPTRRTTLEPSVTESGRRDSGPSPPTSPHS